MMSLLDIAGIVFACTAANHLGLIGKLEEMMGELPIVHCPKCFSFWSVLACLIFSGTDVITSLAVSFLCAWSAVWLDLLMGIIDQLYLKIYEQIYPTAYTADTDTVSSADAMPELPGDQG